MSALPHVQIDSFVVDALTWITATCSQKDQPCLSLNIEIALKARCHAWSSWEAW